VGDNVEDIKRRLAELSAEIEILKLKYATCLEAIAKLRAELNGVKRRVRGIHNLNVETLKAYNEVEADGPEPP
jgi:regulator of replication initiation timing